MATVVKSMSVEGIDGFEVEVEATTIRGQQQSISIIGLGDQAVKEAGERMQAALEFCGYEIPKEKVIISLAPGNKRKKGSHYDLAIAIALLQQTEQITTKELDKYALIGELSLNGVLRPCNGILPMVTEAKNRGIEAVIIPCRNWKEAENVTGIKVYGMENLRDTIRFLEGRSEPPAMSEKTETFKKTVRTERLDFADVKGQEAAKRGHNILMIGEPGCGKTMIAERISTILPKMTEKEALEVTKIHSISGLLQPDHGLVSERPFRAPHHNVSLNALIGGGSYAQPGEVSLAHNGVLFLDGTNTYPSNFMFVAAMNPCPCGYHPSPRCKCTDYEIVHYRGKISGPILERIDIQKTVRHVNYFSLSDEKSTQTSTELRSLVEKARKIQQERFKEDEFVNCNAQMTTAMIQKYCKLDEESTEMLKNASEKFGYSARVIHKLLRLARTAADLRNSVNIEQEDVRRVLNCRDLDKSNNEMYVIQ